MAGHPGEVQVLATVPKARDLEAHVRHVVIDGVEVVELRDHITSLGEYGRGYWLPADKEGLQRIIDVLQSEVARL